MTLDPFSACDRTLVVFTELEDNPGTSVTNAIESLASTVASHLALDPSKVVWVDRYPPGKIHGRTEDWDVVTFARILHDGFRSVCQMLANDWISIGHDPANLVL